MANAQIPDGASAVGQGQPEAGEEVVYFDGRPALRGHFGILLACVLLAAAIVAGAAIFLAQVAWILWAAVVLAVVLVAVPVIVIRSVRYRISNYRIDYERGLLSRTLDTLELWHIEDLSMHQSLMDRILGIGQITVLSHDDTTPRMNLQALPNPRPVFETLKQRIITVKRQRGVIKLDAG